MSENVERAPWSQIEVEAIVAVYFGMLEKQLAGVAYSKADENRNLGQLITRSQSSIERKHSNISAVLVELNYAYVSGYKPLPHYQKLLKAVVEARLAKRPDLDAVVESFVERPAEQREVSGMLPTQVAPPKSKKAVPYVAQGKRVIVPIRKNFLEQESRNRSLGLAGEELILKVEHKRLWEAGQRGLADRIEHVSATKGDGLGFDILSFEADGKERLIEVKTTRLGVLTPFYATRNEVSVSVQRKHEYRLYRLFDFGKEPRFFELTGSLRDTCILEPVSYSAFPG